MWKFRKNKQTNKKGGTREGENGRKGEREMQRRSENDYWVHKELKEVIFNYPNFYFEFSTVFIFDRMSSFLNTQYTCAHDQYMFIHLIPFDSTRTHTTNNSNTTHSKPHRNHTEWLKRKAKGNGTKTTKVIFHATFFVFHRRHSNFYLILFFSASVIYITLTFEYSFNLMLLTKIALSRLACVCIKKYSSNMNCSLLRSSKDPIHFFPSAFVHCFVVFSSFSSFSFGTIHSTPSSAYFLCGVIYLVFYFISLFRCNEFILYIGNWWDDWIVYEWIW